ncbi:hypothetical protein HDU97_010270 [Phlyctochytrium planicorne]|nr:hypothetical protein HDU97_010270 [Phlyctochytrium planicorne]
MKRKAEDEVSDQANGRVQKSKTATNSIPSPPASGDYRRASTASVSLPSSEESGPLSPASVQDSLTTPGDSQVSRTLALIDSEIEDSLKEVALENAVGSPTSSQRGRDGEPRPESVHDDTGFDIGQAVEEALGDVSGETELQGETAVRAPGLEVLLDVAFLGLSLPPRSISPPPPSTTSNTALPSDTTIPDVASRDFSLADFINLASPPTTTTAPFKTTTAAATATLCRSAAQGFDPDVEQFFNDIMGVPPLPLQQDLLALPNSDDFGALLNSNILDSFSLPGPVLPDKPSKNLSAKTSNKKRKVPDHRRAKKRQLDSAALHDLHDRPRAHAWTPFHFRALEAIKPMLPANASVNETYLFLLELLDLLHWKKGIAEKNSAISPSSSSESHNPSLADISVRRKTSPARLAPLGQESLTFATKSPQSSPADIMEQVMSDTSAPLPPAPERRDDGVDRAEAISSTVKAVAAPFCIDDQAATISADDISPEADSVATFSTETLLGNIDSEECSLSRASTPSSVSISRTPECEKISSLQTSRASKRKKGLATEVLKLICVKTAEALRANQRHGKSLSVSNRESSTPVLDISNTQESQPPRSNADVIPTPWPSGNQNGGTKLPADVLKALYAKASAKLGLKGSIAEGNGKEIISPPSKTPEPQIRIGTSKPISDLGVSSQLPAAEEGIADTVPQPNPAPSAAPEDPMSMLASLALATAPLQASVAQPNQVRPSPIPQAAPSKLPKTRRRQAKIDTSIHNPRSYGTSEPTIDIIRDPVTKLFHCPIQTCTAPGAIRRYNMLCHFKTMHMKVKNHLCEVCGQGFAKSFDLQRHMVARHTNALLESVLEKSS